MELKNGQIIPSYSKKQKEWQMTLLETISWFQEACSSTAVLVKFKSKICRLAVITCIARYTLYILYVFTDGQYLVSMKCSDIGRGQLICHLVSGHIGAFIPIYLGLTKNLIKQEN